MNIELETHYDEPNPNIVIEVETEKFVLRSFVIESYYEGKANFQLLSDGCEYTFKPQHGEIIFGAGYGSIVLNLDESETEELKTLLTEHVKELKHYS